MTATFRPQHLLALLTALGLGLISGCENKDAGFHGYTEPTNSEVPVVADQGPQTRDNGVVPAAAETIKPLPEGAVVTTQRPDPTTALVAPITNPDSIGAPTPTFPVTSGVPSAVRQPVTPELALAIPPAPPAAETIARPLELLIPEKTFSVEGSDGTLRVSFDDIDLLKVLNAEPVPLDVEQHLPGWLSGLNGKTVRIRGWMFPPEVERGLRGFLFVRDNQICCFGRTAKIYDKIGVRMRTGETTDYILGHPFDVVGRMVIQTRLLDGEWYLLYRIEDAVVIDQ
jgi:hypothetical protein